MAKMVYIFHGKMICEQNQQSIAQTDNTKKWMHGADLNKSAPERNPDDPATSASPHHPHT